MGAIENHAGKELELLLNGAKPLAVFCISEGDDEQIHFGAQDFMTHVNRGTLDRLEQVFEFDSRPVTYIAFVLPSESWRAHAYFHLKHFMFERSWCSHLEWIEGSLLGYTDEENKAHMRRKYGKKGAADSC